MYRTQPLVTQPSLTIIDSSSSTNRDHPFLPLRRLPLLVPPLINPSSLQLPFRQSLPLQLSHPFKPSSLSAQTLSHLPSALSSSRSCARCACRPSGGESDQTESADETSLSERPTRADPDRAVLHTSNDTPVVTSPFLTSLTPVAGPNVDGEGRILSPILPAVLATLSRRL